MRLRREHKLWVEVHERLIRVVVDAIVHRHKVAVTANLLDWCLVFQEGIYLVDVTAANLSVVLADKASNCLLARVICAELVSLGHIRSHKAVVLVACIAKCHAAYAMDGD